MKIHVLILSFLACVYLSSSCSNSKRSNVIVEINQPIVGDDVDANGCKPSTGTTWSAIEKECIRVFELENKLTSLDGSTLAGVLFSSDKSKAEVFAREGVFILENIGENNYESKGLDKNVYLKLENSTWIFGYLNPKSTLYKQ